LLKDDESGTAAGGAATMLAFGLGTSGTLALVGIASQSLPFRPGRRSSVVAAAGIAIIGVILLWRGISGGHAGHVHHC
jgi:sulfite exporter TauE/SafE